MLNEYSLTKEERAALFNIYRQWFDEKGFEVHWDELEFINFKDKDQTLKGHWKVDATIETIAEGKKTHTFFMTPSTLSMWMGFKKPHGVVMRPTSDYKPDRFEGMREVVNENR